ncbi:short chain dehydrogenase reductase [Thozetella sp. PMI_491]|nr:short chain dehydrogenase reductase [Thozetella sp. PMI_491]
MSEITPTTTIALVSGANQGIGKAVALRLAKEHNYFVLIGSRNLAAGEALAEEIRAAGHGASALQLDLVSEDSITAAVSTITDKYGRLDVLVNNAGVLLDEANAFKDVAKMPTRELFEKTFNVNVIGTACLTEALLPLLLKAIRPPGPRVVFVSSTFGSIDNALNPDAAMYDLDFKAYDSSKVAVNMLAINYARILRDVGGLVNVACPGLVSTDLIAFSSAGDPPELGAQRIVELATLAEGGPTATFSNRHGPVAW